MDIKNTVISAKLVIESLICLLEHENADISSIKFKVGSDSEDYESPEIEFQKLIDIALNGLDELKNQTVPEGFLGVPTNNLKYFSNDGENYEIHDTLSGAKHEAKCSIQHYEDMLADQQFDPTCDGNFAQVGYGVVLAKSGYSVVHVVTQEDINNEDYSYEVGTQIMSLHLDEVKIEVQEQSHD